MRVPTEVDYKPTMKISTIVPAYNCQSYLRRAVESLLATQYKELEIVIIDDGSSDGTLAVANQLALEHPEIVRVLVHLGGKNRGVSASRNLGIESSTGELLAFLDADDYVYPWRFENAAELLQNEPGIDAVHQLSKVELSEETSAQFWRAGNLLFGFQVPIPSDELLYHLLRGFCWATSTVLLRRSLLSEIGLFETSLRVCEDCHFWMRMASCGTVVSGDLSRPVSVYWRRDGSAYKPSPWQRLHMIRAMSSFYLWLRCRDASDPRLPTVAQSISRYILAGVEEARLSGQRYLAWSLATRGVVCFPGLCQESRFYGNIARLVLGR